MIYITTDLVVSFWLIIWIVALISLSVGIVIGATVVERAEEATERDIKKIHEEAQAS